MSEWVSVETVSDLLDLTPRAIRYRIRSGEIKSRNNNGLGRGGKTIQVDLNTLPLPAQIEYHKRKQLGLLNQPQENIFETYPESSREEAHKKLQIIEQWRTFLRRNEGKKVELTDKFVELWNASNKQDNLSRPTLYRWDKAYRENGLPGLCPEWGSRKGITKMDDDAWEFFKYIFLDQSRKTIARCYDLLEMKAGEMGWTIPSLRQVQRLVKQRIPEPVLIFYREGVKAYTDSCEPYIMRDYDSIVPNQLWVSDHNQLDLAVRGPNGKPAFPWATVWMDARSRKMVGWLLSFGPNQDTILASFRRGVLKYGVPKEILIDNGKDYRSKAFAGGRESGVRVEVNEPQVKGLISHFDIVPHFAIPYNAKSKHIERSFRTIREWFSSWFKSYRGANIMERPERLNKILKNPDKLMTIEELAELYEEFIENIYNCHEHEGAGMDGKSPDEIYYSKLQTKRTTSEDSLKLLMMKTTEARVVQRNGIRLFDHWFWNEEISMLQGQKVYARYDQEELGKIYVFDLNDRFLCQAENKELVVWGATQEDYRKANSEKKRVKSLTKSYRAMQEELVVQPDDLKRVLERKKAEKEAMQIEKSSNIIQIFQTPFNETSKKIVEATQEREDRHHIRRQLLEENTNLFRGDSKQEVSAAELWKNMTRGK